MQSLVTLGKFIQPGGTIIETTTKRSVGGGGGGLYAPHRFPKINVKNITKDEDDFLHINILDIEQEN